MKAGDKHKFDELFKQSFDGPEDHFEFDEAHWDSMEDLLPGEKKRARVFPIGRAVAIAASVLIVLAFGWWMLNPTEQSGKQLANNGQKAIKADSIAIDQPTVASPSKDIAGKVPTGQPVMAQAKVDVVKPGRATKQDRFIAGPHRSRRSPVNAGSVSTNAPSTPMVKQGDDIIKQDDRMIAQNPVMPSQDTVVAVASAGTNTTVIVGGEATDTAPKLSDAVPVNNVKMNDAVKSRPVGLAISAILSPSFNGVGSLRDSKMGKTAGLIFSVGVSNKLTISTGAVYSQVPYATDYSSYISTYNFYTKPTGVMADCRVLDIPLTVDYQVYRQGRNSFNIGAGLSSYFMLKETYDYQFASSYTFGPSSFSVSNRNKHIFGVLDLSTTYQRKLNNKFSIGLQPYLKLPLTDIGNNRVKLQTAGIALSASWTIINKNP